MPFLPAVFSASMQDSSTHWSSFPVFSFFCCGWQLSLAAPIFDLMRVQATPTRAPCLTNYLLYLAIAVCQSLPVRGAGQRRKHRCQNFYACQQKSSLAWQRCNYYGISLAASLSLSLALFVVRVLIFLTFSESRLGAVCGERSLWVGVGATQSTQRTRPEKRLCPKEIDCSRFCCSCYCCCCCVHCGATHEEEISLRCPAAF